MLESRIGPCDVTSKSDLEKLIEDMSSREKYLNLLSMELQISWLQLTSSP